MYNVTKSGLGKDSLKKQDKRMDFNVTECKKFINTVLDSLLKLNFKQITVVKFLYSTKGKLSRGY